MNPIIWIAFVAIVVIGGFWYWRKRRQRATRMISFVALLREPMTVDPAVLAKTAGRVWNADLGDGTNEGEDGFVVCADSINSIFFRGRPYLVNSFPRPYVDDPDSAAKAIPDLRIANLFREHRAWFSCDVLGVDGTTPVEEVADCYRRLAKLFAEFLDDTCSLIFIPDIGRGFPINEDTQSALQSDDPLAALQETVTLPLVGVSADDPLVLAAVEEANKTWPQFLSAFEAGAGENFSIKAPVSHSGNTEYIWVSVTAVEGDRIYGTLGNDPANLGPLKCGSKVSVPVADLNDWCYFDPQQNLQGGFSIAAVQTAARRLKKS